GWTRGRRGRSCHRCGEVVLPPQLSAARTAARRSRALKRCFDLGLASISLVILSPLFFLAWIRIKRDSDGPVIYRATRIGRRGRRFTMYKLRTMVVDADPVVGPGTSEEETR